MVACHLGQNSLNALKHVVMVHKNEQEPALILHQLTVVKIASVIWNWSENAKSRNVQVHFYTYQMCFQCVLFILFAYI